VRAARRCVIPQPKVAAFASLEKRERQSTIGRRAAAIVKSLPLGIGAKAGVVADVASQIESHIELRAKQLAPSLPTAATLRADDGAHARAIECLASATTVEEETAARDALAQEARAGKHRPILLLKNRVSDGYLLLHDVDRDRYFAWVNLYSSQSRFARPMTVNGLVDVRTAEVVSFTSATGLLFPIAFSRGSHLAQFIAKARPQSAKLAKTGNRYELHVTFEYETPMAHPAAWLGVDRGIYNLAALTAVDDTGKVLAAERVDGRDLRHVQRIEERRQKHAQAKGRRYTRKSRKAMADEAVHVAANRIVERAKQANAQVVIEDLRQLTGRAKPRARNPFNRLLNRTQYAKLRSVLEYKLAVAGLPPPKRVAAAHMSQTCPCCGHRSPENRKKTASGGAFIMDRFHCQRCGYAANADENAARVIALRRIWRERLPAGFRTKLSKELPERHRLEQFLRDRAARRGDGPGDREVGATGGHDLDGHEDGEVPPREQSRLSLGPDRTHRREKMPATTLSQHSPSGEKPPLPKPKDNEPPAT
jgi:IS605 OrfB family transposase